MLSHLILLIKSLQPLDRLLRDYALNHWPVLFIVSSKVSYVFHQRFDILFQGSQILSLFNCQVLADLL